MKKQKISKNCHEQESNAANAEPPASAQSNVSTAASEATTAPQAPPLRSFSTSAKAEQRKSSISENEKKGKPNIRLQGEPGPKPPPEHINEILETVGKEKGAKILGKDRHRKDEDFDITEKSTSGEIQAWLIHKGFSARVQDLLADLTGAYLFSLPRPRLIEACGREEGIRLYSQILLQKKRSNYNTPSRKELNAILNFRKSHVDATNEAPGEEPAVLPDRSDNKR